MTNIPDARLWGPTGIPKCDCLKKTQASRYRQQYMCEECEPIIAKLERMGADDMVAAVNALIDEMDRKKS